MTVIGACTTANTTVMTAIAIEASAMSLHRLGGSRNERREQHGKTCDESPDVPSVSAAALRHPRTASTVFLRTLEEKHYHLTK